MIKTKKIDIQDTENIVGIGVFLGIREVGGFSYEEGLKLDAIMAKMDKITLAALSTQLSQSMAAIVKVYPKIKERVNPKKPSDAVKTQVNRYSKYSDYVKSMATLPIGLMQAVSTLNKESGAEENNFTYEDGKIFCTIAQEKLEVQNAPQKCQDIFKSRSVDVEVKNKDRIIKYAKKVCTTKENRKIFLESPKKIIDDISIVDTSNVVGSGQLDIHVGARVSSVSVKNVALKTYMCSNTKDLKVFHTTKEGKTYTGATIQRSTVFIKDGFDTASLGVKKNINKAMIAHMGLEGEIDDGEAKAHFLSCLTKNAQNIFAIEQGREDVIPLPSAVLFNPSWMAEDYAKTKNNNNELKLFDKKYELVMKSTLIYTGAGGFSYVLKLNTRNTKIPSAIFMNLPSMCERFIGYYNLYRTFNHKYTFSEILDKYIRFQNMSKVGILLDEALCLGKMTIAFTTEFFGVGKTDTDRGALAADLYNKDMSGDDDQFDDESLSEDAWGDAVTKIKIKNGVQNQNSYQKHDGEEGDPNKDPDAVENEWADELGSFQNQQDDTVEEVKQKLGKIWEDFNFVGLKDEDLIINYLRAFVLYNEWSDFYPDLIPDYNEDLDVNLDLSLGRRCRAYLEVFVGEKVDIGLLQQFEDQCTFDKKVTFMANKGMAPRRKVN